MAAAPAGTTLTATGFAASLATAQSGELGRYRAVHFATHGLVDSENPGLSGILLSMVDERGREQSGFPKLKVADPLRDGELLRLARDEAFAIIDQDPELKDPTYDLLKSRARALYPGLTRPGGRRRCASRGGVRGQQAEYPQQARPGYGPGHA